MPTLTLSNITTGIPYTFQVQYLFLNGTLSQPNGTILLTSQNETTQITYPEGVSAPSQITNVSASLNTQSQQIVLTWTQPNDNGKPILGYVVWGIHNGSLFIVGVASPTVNTANISNLSSPATYLLAVSAINEVGFAQPSEILSVKLGESVPCLVEGQEILTSSGFKCVEKLTSEDRIITSDGRAVTFKLYTTYIAKTTAKTAPYYIPANTFGNNTPSMPIILSPLHAIQIGSNKNNNNNQWQIPKYAALDYKKVKQINIGKPIRYYHIELPNYFTDNLVAKGNIVLESYANNQVVKAMGSVYKYNSVTKCFTRVNNTNQNYTSKNIS